MVSTVPPTDRVSVSVPQPDETLECDLHVDELQKGIKRKVASDGNIQMEIAEQKIKNFPKKSRRKCANVASKARLSHR